MNPLTNPWPFAQWRLDIGGTLLWATAIRRWLLVATDYFTKWVEAEPLANIHYSDVKRFVWKKIVTRFGIPQILVSDNDSDYSELGIINRYLTLGYPQGNFQAKATNKSIVNGLKRRLDDSKGKWIEELPSILWAHRTTPCRSTSETPFLMTYESEAVIPTEVGMPTT